MARYVDADKLIETLKNPPLHNSLGGMCMQDVLDIIDDMPKEDVKHVEYGRWKCTAIGRYECTNCGYEPIERTQYCGHCGAKMKGERTEDV